MKKYIFTFFILAGALNYSIAQTQIENYLKVDGKPEQINSETSELTTTVKKPTSLKLLEKIKSVAKIEIQSPLGKEKQSTGSGTLISSDGLILTNYHVISGNFFNPEKTKIIVLFDSHEPIEGQLIKVDIVSDLAILKINTVPPDLSIIEINSETPKPGDQVYSVGYPHGWSITILEGLFNTQLTTSFAPQFLLSNALSPGMSGGPTFDVNGDMIAINVAATDKLSIVIPSQKAKALLDEINQEKANKSTKPNIKKIRQEALINYKHTITSIIKEIKQSKPINIGTFTLPIKNSMFDCWSQQGQKDNQSLDNVSSRTNDDLLTATRLCSTKDSFFLNEKKYIGTIEVRSFYTQNKNMDDLFFRHLITNKYNAIAIPKKKKIENCAQINATNNNGYLTNLSICLEPNKESSLLINAKITTLYQKNNEFLILDYILNGIFQENILDFLSFVKKI